jgi:hypothetical protein
MDKKNSKKLKFKSFGGLAFILLILYFFNIFSRNLSFIGGRSIFVDVFIFPLFLVILLLVFLSFKYSNSFDRFVSILCVLVLVIVFAYLLFGNSYYENGNYYLKVSRPYNALDIIKYKLKNVPDELGTLIYSESIKFSIDKVEYISTATITKDTGFSHHQLIFSTNGYNNDFQVSDDCSSRIKILSKDPVEYKLGFLCGDTKEDLIENINSYNLSNINISNFCGEANKRTCVVFPEK